MYMKAHRTNRPLSWLKCRRLFSFSSIHAGTRIISFATDTVDACQKSGRECGVDRPEGSRLLSGSLLTTVLWIGYKELLRQARKAFERF